MLNLENNFIIYFIDFQKVKFVLGFHLKAYCSNPGISTGQVVRGGGDRWSDFRFVFVGKTRASFTSVTSVWSHKVICSEKPMFGFRLCCYHLEIIIPVFIERQLTYNIVWVQGVPCNNLIHIYICEIMSIIKLTTLP